MTQKEKLALVAIIMVAPSSPHLTGWENLVVTILFLIAGAIFIHEPGVKRED